MFAAAAMITVVVIAKYSKVKTTVDSRGEKLLLSSSQEFCVGCGPRVARSSFLFFQGSETSVTYSYVISSDL